MRKKGGSGIRVPNNLFFICSLRVPSLFRFCPAFIIAMLQIFCTEQIKLFNHWTGLSCSADIKLLTLTELSDGAIIICLKFKNMQ
jgi:hypothetical protein